MAQLTEHWLPVPGYEGLYEVSDQGRVRGLRNWHGNPEGHVLSPAPNHKGYVSVTLRDHAGRGRTRYIHTLVLLTFRGPCPVDQLALHGPAGVSDNSLSNLRYGTSAQNAADKIRDGTRQNGERHGNAKLTWDIIRDIRARVAAGEPQKNLAQEYDVTSSSVSLIVNKKNWWPDG